MIRYYLMPKARDSRLPELKVFIPKYIADGTVSYKNSDDTIREYSQKNFGPESLCIVRIDTTDDEDAKLTAQTDVVGFPADPTELVDSTFLTKIDALGLPSDGFNGTTHGDLMGYLDQVFVTKQLRHGIDQQTLVLASEIANLQAIGKPGTKIDNFVSEHSVVLTPVSIDKPVDPNLK